MRIILTLTFGMFLLQWFAATLGGTRGGLDPLSGLLGLRAWYPSGPPGLDGRPLELSFNLFFPVQLFSYMLVHSLAGISHVAFNMLFLWFFGRELEASMGRAGFLRLYVTAGVLGGLVQWVFDLTQGGYIPVVGASGAVYAVMMLYALRWPRRTIIIFPIFIPVPVIFVMVFRVVTDLMGFMSGAAGVAFLVHLGGAAVGALWFRRGDVVARARAGIKRHQHEKARAVESEGRQEMDRILRKIQASGLASLSADERAFLDRRSRELRERKG